MRVTAAWCCLLILHGWLAAADAAELKFNQGDVLRYRVTENTVVEIQNKEESFGTAVSLQLVKSWTVKEVAANGDAVLELSFESLRFEQTDPTGRQVVFDSKNTADSNPDLVKQMSKMVSQPAQRVTVRKDGSVVSRESLMEGIPIRTELPFYVTVPQNDNAEPWTQELPIQLPPPLDTKYAATQNLQVKSADDKQLVISWTTELGDKPAEPQHMLAIIQYLPAGAVTLDRQRGVVTNAEVKIDKSVDDFDGQGSKYSFTSNRKEELLP